MVTHFQNLSKIVLKTATKLKAKSKCGTQKNQIIIIIILKCGDFFQKKGYIVTKYCLLHILEFSFPEIKTPLVNLGVNLVVPTPTKVIRLSIMGKNKFKRGGSGIFFFPIF
jgi:hypothetical protein